MKKGSLLIRKLLVMLMVIVTMSTIAVVASVSLQASATPTNYYYYPAGTQFVSRLAVFYSTKSGDAGKSGVTNGGYNLLSKDVNASAGGNWIYMGYRTSTDISQAITHVRIRHNDGTSSPISSTVNGQSVSFTIVGGENDGQQLDGIVDLNRDAGGDYIYAYYTRDWSAGPGITGININTSWNDSGWTSAVRFDDTSAVSDLNRDSGGDDVIVHFQTTGLTDVTSQINALQAAVTRAGTFTQSRYTSGSWSTLTSAKSAGQTILNAYNNSYRASSAYTQAQITSATNTITNAINALQTTVYLNATTNGGTCSTSSFVVTIGANSTVSANVSSYTASKTNYVFNGWSTNSSATSGNKSAVTVGFNQTIYASFYRTLVGTFNYYNATGTATSSTVSTTIYNNTTSGNITTPAGVASITKDGYTYSLLGWRSDTTATTAALATGATATLSANATYYGVYSRSISVSYNANGGSGAPSTQSVTKYLNAYGTSTSPTVTISATKPTRTGYTFKGWNYTSTSSENLNNPGIITPVSATTLYAGWTINTYVLNWVTDGVPSTEQVSYSSTITLRSASKPGYTFNSWAWKNTASGATISQPTTMPAYNVTATAQFTPNTYNIVFNGNGSTGGSMSNLVMTYDTAKALTSNAFTRTGYIFAGWNTAADGSGISYINGSSVNNLATSGNFNLYAKWTPVTYTVEFNSNGGTGTMNNQTFTYDASQALTANAFSRTGYAFAGWADSATGTVKYADKASVKNLVASGTKTLYAKWTANTYTIAFNGNGSTSGSTANVSATYDSNATLTSNGFVKPGYTFAGWAESATGAVKYANGATVKNLALSGTKTLYAKWTANTYTIIFDNNTGSGSMANLTATYDSAATLTANAFTKAGYDFIQWNTAANGSGTSYADKATVTNLVTSGNVTLYAQWANATYNVTYSGTGINTANCTPLYATGDRTLTATVYAADGYHLNSTVAVKVGANTLTSGYTYVLSADKLSATLTVNASSVIGHVAVTANAAAHAYTDHYAGTAGTATHTAYCSCGAYITESCTGGAATCTALAVCEKCNTTYGKALGHDWDEGVVTTAATCTDEGVKTFSCKRCGETYTEPVAVDKANHGTHTTHDAVIKQATCAQKGTMGTYCDGCNTLLHTTDIAINSANHVVQETGVAYTTHTGVITAATCTAKGTMGNYCDGCNALISTSEIAVNAANHGTHETYEAVITAATCTDKGSMGTYCKGCKALLSTAEIAIDAANHGTHETYEAVITAATCTDKGSMGTYCEGCKVLLSTAEIAIDAANHGEHETYEAVITPSTCTDKGTMGVYCDGCKVLLSTKEIAENPENHNGHGTYNRVITAATCTDKGTMGTYCEGCKALLSTADIAIDAANHGAHETYEAVITAATCTDKGTMGVYCEGCDALLSTKEIAVNAANHGTHETYEAVITAATCTDKGSMGTYCKGCNALLSTAEIAIDAANHGTHETYEAVITAATCTDKGSMGTYCEGCDALLSTAEIAIDAENHGTHETYKSVITAATCTDKGSMGVYCEGCKELLSTEDIAIDAANHTDYETYEAVITAATCTDKGSMGTYCEGCDALLSTAEIAIDAANHGTHETYEAVITAATCTDKGTMGVYCKGCDALLTTKEIAVDAANHGTHETYEAVITAATCTDKGSMGTYCEGCKALLSTAEIAIDAANHGTHETYEAVITAATCTDKGSMGTYCEGCKALLSTAEIAIDAANHGTHETYEAVITAATCTDKGSMGVYCKGCDTLLSTKEIAIDAANHGTYETYEAVITAATCTDKGSMGTYCKGCNALLSTADIAIDAANHGTHETYEAVITAATCTDKGTMGVYCKGCDALLSTKEIAIDAANHGTHETYEAVITAATCTDKGVMGTYCEGCKALLSTAEIAIDAANHGTHETYEAVITAATCTDKGSMGTYCEGCKVLLSTADIAINAANHGTHETYEAVITAATCTDKGTMGVYCKGCDVLLSTEDIAIDAANHADYETYEAVITAATCTDKGTMGTYCEGCKALLSTADIAIDAANHGAHETYEAVITAATCTDKGTMGVYCEGCDELLNTEDIEINANNHADHGTYKAVVTAATCTDKGVMGTYCDGCDALLSTADIEINAANHGTHTTYDSVITASTCTKLGTMGTYCTGCKVLLSTKKIDVDASNHADNTTHKAVITASTCTDKGSMGTYCDGCDALLKEDEIAPLGHEFSGWYTITASTCTVEGQKRRRCSRCGESEVEAIALDPNNHVNTVKTEAVAATCSSEGYTAGVICGDCMTYVSGHDVIAVNPEAHSWDKGVVTKEPTCTLEGRKVCTCVYNPSHTSVQTIDALGHDMQVVEGNVEGGTCTWTSNVCSRHDYTDADVHLSLKYDNGTPMSNTKLSVTVGNQTKTVVTDENGAAVVNFEQPGDCTITIEAGGYNVDITLTDEGHIEFSKIYKSDHCTCICHRTGIMKLIYNVVIFFSKLFNVNKVCYCGVNHY